MLFDATQCFAYVVFSAAMGRKREAECTIFMVKWKTGIKTIFFSNTHHETKQVTNG
jgi:hypothetical protein